MTPGGSGRWFCRLLTYLGLVLGARGPRAAASPRGYLPKSAGLPTSGAPHLLRQRTGLGSSAASCRTIGHHNCSSLRMNSLALISVIAVLAIPAVAKTERMGAAQISPNHVVGHHSYQWATTEATTSGGCRLKPAVPVPSHRALEGPHRAIAKGV